MSNLNRVDLHGHVFHEAVLPMPPPTARQAEHYDPADGISFTPHSSLMILTPAVRGTSPPRTHACGVRIFLLSQLRSALRAASTALPSRMSVPTLAIRGAHRVAIHRAGVGAQTASMRGFKVLLRCVGLFKFG